MMAPMPIRVTPDEAAARWVSGMQGASARYTSGVQAVTVSPTAKAAQAVDTWANNVANSRDRFVRGLNKVSLADWQTAAAAGAANLGTGAQRKQQKFLEATQTNFQNMASVVSQVDSMPKSTYADRRARALAFMDGMHAKSGKP